MMTSPTTAQPAGQQPSAEGGSRDPILTPRAVERRYPDLRRSDLAKRRKLGLPPEYEVHSGVILYAQSVIERFRAEQAEDMRPGAPPRCAIYVRADSLFDPSAEVCDHVKACEEYLPTTGWKFAGSCVDFGNPNIGRNLRGGFWSLLLRATLGDFDILLVYNKDHISTDARALAAFEQRLTVSGVRIHELNPRLRTTHPLRCVVYARVACVGYGDTPLQKQTADCIAYARRKGWKITGTYSDVGTKAVISARSSLRGLIEDARASTFDIMLGADIDRFSRDPSELHWLFKQMRGAGIQIHSVSDDRSISDVPLAANAA